MRGDHLIVEDIRDIITRHADRPFWFVRELKAYIRDHLTDDADDLDRAADFWGITPVDHNPDLTIGELGLSLAKYDMAQVIKSINWAKVDWNMIRPDECNGGSDKKD